MHDDHLTALAQARIHDQAKVRAHELRKNAISAFWQHTGTALHQGAHALVRTAAKRLHAWNHNSQPTTGA